MTTNLPPEPDEFQTRMRPPQQGDVEEDTNRSGGQAQQSVPPQQPAQPQFAPPGFGGASQPQPPAGYGIPQSQQPTRTFSAQSQPTQGFEQAGQAANPWAQQQPVATGGFAQQPGGFAQLQQPQQPQSGPWAGQPPRDANPLKAAFDLGFNSYATPGIVKIVYIIGMVLAGLWFLLSVLYAFVSFSSAPLLGIVTLLVGWVPALFFVLVLRLLLEQALASVRTATDVRVLRERSDEQSDEA